MPRQYCVHCRGWRDSWYDTCGERCGNECRERRRSCDRFFATGELVRRNDSELVRANRETQKEVARTLAQHADSSGGNVEMIGSAYETHIVYHPPRR